MAKQKVETQVQNNGKAQETQEQETSSGKLTRWAAAYEAVKTMNSHEMELDDLGKLADKLYLESNGLGDDESDVDKASGQVQGILETLENLGLVEMEWHCRVTPKVDLTSIRLNARK